MSGLRITLDQLPPAMRAQAQRKLSAEALQRCKRGARRGGMGPKKKDPAGRLAFYLKAEGLGGFELEHRFHETRKWRIDIAFVEQRLAIEIEGVTAEGGRHQRIAGFREDIKKYNELMLAGWRLLRFLPEMVSSGHAVTTIKRALEARSNHGGESGAGNARKEEAGHGHRAGPA